MKRIKLYRLFENAGAIMYHVSPFFNRLSISKNGLAPAGGPTPWPEDVFPKGVYLFNNIADARRYGFGNGDPFDIWEVSVGKHTLKDDPVVVGAFYTQEIICASDIKVIESHVKDVTNSI